MNLGGLFVEIMGDPSHLYRTIGQARTALTGLKAPTLSLGGLSTGAITGLTAALAAASAAMAGLGVYAAKTSVDLEKAWSGVRKTTGLVGADMAELKTSLENLAATRAGVTLDEIIEVAAMAGRLGVQGAKGITEYTDAISQIRIALDDIPAEDAARDIARILNVYQLGTEHALSFASALNKLDDTSTATGRDILEVSQRLSGTASTLGLSPQKLLAFSAALKDAGIETEVAGTAFSQLFAKLASEPAKFAEVAGKSVTEFTDTLRSDPLVALREFIDGLKKFDSISQFKVLNDIGLDGQRTAGSLLQLSNVISKLDGMVANANEEWISHDSILKEVGIQGETASAQMTMMWNNVRLLADGVGQIALPAIKALAQEIGLMAKGMKSGTGEGDEGMKEFAESVAASIHKIGFAIRNMDTIWELGKLEVYDFTDSIKQRLTELATWIGGGFLSMIKTPLGTIGESINLASDLVSGKFTPGEGMDKIMNLGIKTAVGASGLGINTPEINVGGRAKESEDVFKTFASKNEEARQKLLAKLLPVNPGEPPKPPSGVPPKKPEGGGKGYESDKDKKPDYELEDRKRDTKSDELKRRETKFTDLESFAKQLQIGALSKADVAAEKTATNTGLLLKKTITLIEAVKSKPLEPGVMTA